MSIIAPIFVYFLFKLGAKFVIIIATFAAASSIYAFKISFESEIFYEDAAR
jgi:hypothetical protein